MNMDFIHSDKVRRINALTILLVISKIPTDLVIRNFESLMKHVVFEARGEKIKKVSNEKMNTRFLKKADLFSKRKAVLREKQLYQNIKLDVYFKVQMTVS